MSQPQMPSPNAIATPPAAAAAERARFSEVDVDAQRLEVESLTAQLEQSKLQLAAAMEDARNACDRAIASEERLRLVDDASRSLASSLDYEATIGALARAVVPTLADWASVDLLIDAEIKPLALAHVDPDKLSWARALAARYRPHVDAPTGPAAVIRAGQPRLVSHVTDEMLVAAAQDDRHLEILRKVGVCSMMIVPMTVRGRTFGALTLISSRPERWYDESALAVALDLARRAAVAIDNARLYRAALAANEAKTNFLATMSHELRTPLTAIIGYEELLAEGISGEVNEMQGQQLERIKVSATQLLSLIDEILLFARVEAGRESVRLESVVAKGVVEDALSFVAAAAAEQGLGLRADAIDPSLMLRTDVGKLRQMILNLLANAVKFTPRGEVVVRAYERARNGDADVAIVFEVQDTGIGIDCEDIPHIFDPFWQVEQTTTRKIGGSGLGLSVTRRLAQLLGGDVFVESTSFVGSTFQIVLPKTPSTPIELRSL